MRRSGALFRYALVLAGASVPWAWLALSPEAAHGQEEGATAAGTVEPPE